MGSSGIIYAIIVGAWAIYLVPMWLRREDELNRARQTQRYAAAIKVLANKEAFERRWAQSGEADEALPMAVGQNSVSAPAARTTKRATGKGTSARQSQTQGTLPATSTATKSTHRPVAPGTATATTGATVAAATTPSRGVVTAKIAATAGDTRSPRTARSRTAPSPTSTSTASNNTTQASTSRTQTARRATVATGLKAPVARTRSGLMARRRRVVGLLFAVSTLGALVSADLGARYLWAMAIPAVLLSAYIARLRREERIRATAQAAKYAAAQQAREARETELARAEAEAAQAEAEAEAARAEAAEAEATRAQARIETEQRRRAEAARRRASAAARARAQAYTQAQETPDLPQASNG